MRVLVLQHIACEHPGVFGDVLREHGIEQVAVELDAGEPLPEGSGFDAIVAMGGPMSVLDEQGHPWLAPEKQMVAQAVEQGTPFLGVCLGAQLLAAALGARVFPMPAPEVGLLPVELTPEGRADPLLAGLPEPLVTVQWHGDTFDLPAGATLLACSPLAPNQLFRVGDGVYGVQFHLETTAAMVREWGEVPAYAASAAAALGPDGGPAFLELVEREAHGLEAPARRLCENWLGTWLPAAA